MESEDKAKRAEGQGYEVGVPPTWDPGTRPAEGPDASGASPGDRQVSWRGGPARPDPEGPHGVKSQNPRGREGDGPQRSRPRRRKGLRGPGRQTPHSPGW
jgi:hypothetical protein